MENASGDVRRLRGGKGRAHRRTFARASYRAMGLLRACEGVCYFALPPKNPGVCGAGGQEARAAVGVPVKTSHSFKPENREEKELLEKLDTSRLPQHVAAIMDGNGRWAQKRHLPRVAGHRAGINAARAIITACAELKIPYLTLYAFSVENWRRPQTEVDFLMRLLREYLKRELPVMHKNNIRFRVIGREAELPAAVRNDLDEAKQVTAQNTGMNLLIALNYGGRAELVDAFNALLEQVQLMDLGKFRADEQIISDHLYTGRIPDPDLLIRTSGEMRVSNFLLWQIAYAEIYVTETLWPDFSRARLLEALLEYQKRERRYGGLGKPQKRAAEE